MTKAWTGEWTHHLSLLTLLTLCRGRYWNLSLPCTHGRFCGYPGTGGWERNLQWQIPTQVLVSAVLDCVPVRCFFRTGCSSLRASTWARGGLPCLLCTKYAQFPAPTKKEDQLLTILTLKIREHCLDWWKCQRWDLRNKTRRSDITTLQIPQISKFKHISVKIRKSSKWASSHIPTPSRCLPYSAADSGQEKKCTLNQPCPSVHKESLLNTLRLTSPSYHNT